MKRSYTPAIVALCLVSVSLAVAGRSHAADDEADFAPLLSEDTSGWVEEQHEFFKSEHPGVATWTVRDGITRADGSLGNCGFLRYDKVLGDFVLRLDYRMSPMCNSGVGLRAKVPYTTLEPNTLPSNVGYEFQIMDDAGQPANDIGTGSFYAQLAPRVNAARPAGEWNLLEIECRGSRIRATLNWQVVQDIDRTMVPALSGRRDRGYLSLQNHGHDIEFRRVRIKELTPSDE